MEKKSQELIASLKAVADSMRACAEVHEQYARVLAEGAHADVLLPGNKRKHVEDDTGTVKKKKRERDPNAPKRAMSSYFLYQNDVRAEMRRRNPNLPYRELTKLVSDQWGNLNTEQKQIYEQEASLHRQIYTSQKAAYEAKTEEEKEKHRSEVERLSKLIHLKHDELLSPAVVDDEDVAVHGSDSEEEREAAQIVKPAKSKAVEPSKSKAATTSEVKKKEPKKASKKDTKPKAGDAKAKTMATEPKKVKQTARKSVPKGKKPVSPDESTDDSDASDEEKAPTANGKTQKKAAQSDSESSDDEDSEE